jgi:hypothetical protein
MKQNIKEQWVKALRSGKYSQGRIYLRSSSNQYCCLGVLCDLYQQAHPEKSHWIIDRSTCYAFRYQQEGDVWADAYLWNQRSTSLDSNLQDWAGLTREQHGQLITMNDRFINFIHFYA